MNFNIKKKILKNKISKNYCLFVTNKTNKNKNKSIDLLGLNETHFKNKHFTINKFKLLKWLSVNHATIKKNLLKKLTYNFFLNPYNTFIKKK